MNKLKKALVLLSAWLLAFPLWATDVTFKVTPLFRVSQGILQEYVFCDNDWNGSPEYTVSRLDWDLIHIPSYGAQISFDIRTLYNHTFHLTASYILGTATETGKMQDYDWIHMEQGAYCGALTNYSSHTNYLTDFHDISLSGGWTHPSGFGLDVGWDIKKLAFEARGGYKQYGECLGNNQYDHVDRTTEPKDFYPSDKKVISYEYLCNYLKTGVTYRWQKPEYPEVYLGIWIIPLYAAQGTDRHLERSKNFLDVMYGYNCGLVETVAISFPLSSNRHIYFREDGEVINIVKGETYEFSGDTFPTAGATPIGWCGSSRQLITLTVGYTISF